MIVNKLVENGFFRKWL